MLRALALIALTPSLALAAPADLSADQLEVLNDEFDHFLDAEDPFISDFPGYEDDDGYTPMIVNGEEVIGEEYPETVYLGSSGPSGGGTCTGSLIDSEHILTAAHCVTSDTTAITVGFGNSTSSFWDTVEADYWIKHEDYDEDGAAGEPNARNDIGIVHLSSPVTDVLPMSLNADEITQDWVDEELDITHVGFGVTETDASDSGTKRVVETPLYEFNNYMFGTYDPVRETGTCQGDSGGPGLRVLGEAYVQVGITSYGQICGEDPGYMVRVDKQLDWIEEQGATFSTAPAAPPSFRCSRELDPGNSETVAYGVVPFEVRCVTDYANDEELVGTNWSWGDGTDDSYSLDAEHEYTTDGNFTVRACIDGERSGATWQHCVSRIGYVRACDVPDVSFTYEAEGLDVQMLNETDLSVYGCISDILWEIYEGDTATGTPMVSYASWEPEHAFETPGTYTVLLNVGGPAGTAAQQLTIDVKAGAGGCNAAGLGTVGFLPFFLGAAALRRRRED